MLWHSIKTSLFSMLYLWQAQCVITVIDSSSVDITSQYDNYSEPHTNLKICRKGNDTLQTFAAVLVFFVY